MSEDSFTDGVGSASFVVPPISGSAVYLALQLRTKSNGDAYRARVKIERDGGMLVGFSRLNNGNEVRLTIARVAGKVKVGQQVNLDSAISGSTPVRLSARAWIEGTPKPAWQRQYSDSSSARITGAGRVGVWAYLSASSSSPTNLTVNEVRGTSSPATAVSVVPSTVVPSTVVPSTVVPSTVAPSTVAPSTVAPTTVAPTTVAPKTPPVVPSASGVQSTDGKPSASNTGVPAGTKLTRHNGNITVTKNGTVLDKLDIYGFVTIEADNVRITNSRIRGGTATSNRGMITNYDGKNLVIEDTDIAADNQSVWVDGLKGWNFTARRVHVVGGVDSVKIHGDNVRVQDSLLENTNYFANDPNQGGGATHNDNIQILKGKNLNITGNTIRGAQTHTVLATAQQGDASVVIAGNWLDGGICNVKLQTSNGNYLSARVESNKFGPNRIYQKCKISQQSSGNIGLVQSGNSMENSPSTSVAVLKE